MIQIDSTTNTHNRVAEQVNVIIEPDPATTKSDNYIFKSLFLFQCIGRIFLISAIRVRVGLGQIWANYYPRVVVFGEQDEGGVIMPRSTLTFIINVLLGFVEIKSQGRPGFPFQTHPCSIRFSVFSVMMYGLASAADQLISAAGFDHNTSVYAIIARLGRFGALCILVASLSYIVMFDV